MGPPGPSRRHVTCSTQGRREVPAACYPPASRTNCLAPFIYAVLHTEATWGEVCILVSGAMAAAICPNLPCLRSTPPQHGGPWSRSMKCCWGARMGVAMNMAASSIVTVPWYMYQTWYGLLCGLRHVHSSLPALCLLSRLCLFVTAHPHRCTWCAIS